MVGAVNWAFVLHVYQDEEYAAALLPQLRQCHPDAWIGCIFDGGSPSLLLPIARTHRIELHQGQRLKLNQYGAAWTKRWMEMARGKGDWIIRLDPDCWVHRPFRTEPTGDIAGTAVCRLLHHHAIIRGACSAYRAGAVNRILRSGLLDANCYRNSLLYAYRRYGEWRFPNEVESNELIYSEDGTIGHIAKRLGLSLENWEEVRICFREAEFENPDLQWAVTHPHRISNPQPVAEVV